MLRPILAWCTLSALVFACGSDGGYAPLGGSGTSTSPASPRIGEAADAAARNTCGLPAGTAVCDCAELPFAEPPPTLWFVLDRSTSMAQGDKWGLLRSVVLDVVARLGPRIQVAVSPFPRADDGDGECTTGRIALTPRVGDRPAGSHGDTWNLVHSVLFSHEPTGGTPLSATLEVVATAIQKNSGKNVVVLTTDGAPNCDADIPACDASACVPNIENIDQCPIAGDPNCCDPATGSPLNCLDDAAAQKAVLEIAALGADTYVLGIPGSEPYRDLLAALATAGGTAKTSGTRYYAATTTDTKAFADELSSIAAKILATCTIQLSSAPADAGMVNVLIDGVPIQPGDAGWSLAADVVTLHGAACTQVLSGEALDVRVVVGCPTVQVN
jgi:hypothetical protein